jgi:ribonuclease D
MFLSEITKEEVEKLDLVQYEGPISVIDSEEDFNRQIGDIEAHPVLGFDTETRPSFKKGKVFPTALIQFSAVDKAWLIRVSRMGTPRRLIDLLSRDEVIKVGSGLTDDLRRLRSDFQFEPRGFLELQQYVGAFRIEEKGLKKMAAIVLGKRISKSQQVSNWDSEILSEAQLRYAATDAWICLEIYNRLKNTSF